MKTLDACRIEIDAIDQELMALFEKRMRVCKDVVLYKLAHQLEIFQPDREQMVIDKNMDRMEEEGLQPYAANFIQDVMNISKSYQATFVPLLTPYVLEKPKTKHIRVGFQGVEGAFSYQSMKAYFGEVASQAYPQFEDVFKALQEEEITYGIVPLENSSTGAVNDNYDLVRDYNFFIVGEQSISISHYLLGLPGTKLEEVTEVYSHPQALKQCTKFFSKHKHMNPITYTNTAASAKLVQEQGNKVMAAIASLEAAQLYGLEVLQEHIEDQKSNHTRFIIVGKQLEANPTANRISIVFTVQHQAGSLFTILKVIKEYHINLSRIESRPIKNRPWEYYFYLDFEGNLEDKNVQQALHRMKAHCLTLRVLGNYEQK